MVDVVPRVPCGDGIALVCEPDLPGGGCRVSLNDAHQLLVVSDRLVHLFLLRQHYRGNYSDIKNKDSNGFSNFLFLY